MPKESFSQFEKNPGEKPDEMPGETRQDISERIEKETKRAIYAAEAKKAEKIKKLLGELPKELEKKPEETEKRKEKFASLMEKWSKKGKKAEISPETREFIKRMTGERFSFYEELEKSLEEEPSLPEEEKAERLVRLVDAVVDYKTGQKRIMRNEDLLLKLNEISNERPELKGPLLQDFISNALKNIEVEEQRVEEISGRSPEAFLILSISELREYKRQLEREELVKTPDVLEKKKEIIRGLRAGKSFFLFGETGTGKTEMAKEIARKITGQEAEVIRGHRFMTPEEVWGYLGLAPAEGKIKDEEILARIKQQSPKLLKKEQEAVFRACKEALEGEKPSGPVVTKFFAGAVERAAKKGRILIIDEANYIPPGLLASLNEIITEPRPGKKITIPVSGKKVPIKKGFGIIMTGNISFDSVKRYKERYEADPALRDRVRFLEYNTPSQETDAKYDFKDAVKKDLFLIGLTELVDKKGKLAIAGGEDGLRKVWRLCQAFKMFQDNFARKETLPMVDGNGQEFAVPLEKNHASMRKFINILREWQNNGMSYEIDHYVWKELIEPSLPEAIEAAYFYQQLQKLYGFFQTEGWDQNPNYGDKGKLLRFMPKIPEKPNKAPERKIISNEIIAEAIRGKPMPTEVLKTKAERQREEKIKEAKELELETAEIKAMQEKEVKEWLGVCPPLEESEKKVS